MGIRSVLKKIGGYISLAIGALLIIPIPLLVVLNPQGLSNNIGGMIFLLIFGVLLLLTGIWWVKPQIIRKLGVSGGFEENKGGDEFKKMCPKCKGTNTTREWNIGGNGIVIAIFILLFFPLAIVFLLYWRGYVCKKCKIKI